MIPCTAKDAKELISGNMIYRKEIYDAMLKFLDCEHPELSKDLGAALNMRKHTMSRYINYASGSYFWTVVGLRFLGFNDEQAMKMIGLTDDIRMHARIIDYHYKRKGFGKLVGQKKAHFNEITHNQFLNYGSV